jgi:NADH:ubiquinone oxidoreductase subunit F (NADH-binding)
MLEILQRITEGKGDLADLEMLRELAPMVKDASLCGLGQTAPNPVLTTLNYFLDEYRAHIEEKKCPAGVCKALIRYQIIAEACKGCGVCRRACPQKAISGKAKEVHSLDQSLCIKCGICYNECKFDAIEIQ